MLTALGNILYSSALLVIGILLNRFFESRPKLIAYYSHVGAGRVRVSNETTPVFINTHSIVIYNSGRKPALNVRVGHHPIGSVQNMIAVFPPQQFRVETITDAGEEIIFNRILPKQSITLTYIYTGLTANQITAYVRSDEAEAKFFPVIINRKYPLWCLGIFIFLVFIGFVTTAYYSYIYGIVLLKSLNLAH